MAVRPPGNDGETPETIEFGIAALDARLEESDVEFPATQAEIVRELSAEEIPYNASGHTLDLTDALDRAGSDQFETKGELMNALHPIFEERRRHGGGSILERLRAALPF